MAICARWRERIQDVAGELRRELDGGRGHPEWGTKFAEMETEACAIGDALACELLSRTLRSQAEEQSSVETCTRGVFAKSLGYLRNQPSRIRYAEYRRAGLPITSSHVESAIKQFNRRVKGTEKLRPAATEAILRLRADTLSDTRPLDRFRHSRARTATGPHNCHTASQHRLPCRLNPAKCALHPRGGDQGPMKE